MTKASGHEIRVQSINGPECTYTSVDDEPFEIEIVTSDLQVTKGERLVALHRAGTWEAFSAVMKVIEVQMVPRDEA